MKDKRSEILGRAAARVRELPGFVGHHLAVWEAAHDRPAASLLGLDPLQAARLALCRLPRARTWGSDVAAIAAYAGAPLLPLANVLRVAAALESFAGLPSMRSGAVLAAARDRAPDHVGGDLPPAGGVLDLPGWLVDAVDRVWQGEPPAGYPRDLDLAVLTRLPLGVVEIDGLRTAHLMDWLAAQHLPRLANVADRALRGGLLAYGGVALILVDASDDPTERRLTMAHEVGHFLLDYAIPRERVNSRRPELLPVVDGLREPTVEERLDALLADVPIGVHYDLLERDGASHDVATVEDRAELLGLELLAPQADVLTATVDADVRTVARLLVDRYGLPGGAAERYAAYLARVRPRRARTWDDLLRPEH